MHTLKKFAATLCAAKLEFPSIFLVVLWAAQNGLYTSNLLPMPIIGTPIVHIDPIALALADGDGFQCSNSSASNDDFDNEPLLQKLCVLLRMHQNAPQNT